MSYVVSLPFSITPPSQSSRQVILLLHLKHSDVYFICTWYTLILKYNFNCFQVIYNNKSLLMMLNDYKNKMVYMVLREHKSKMVVHMITLTTWWTIDYVTWEKKRTNTGQKWDKYWHKRWAGSQYRRKKKINWMSWFLYWNHIFYWTQIKYVEEQPSNDWASFFLTEANFVPQTVICKHCTNR